MSGSKRQAAYVVMVFDCRMANDPAMMSDTRRARLAISTGKFSDRLCVHGCCRAAEVSQGRPPRLHPQSRFRCVHDRANFRVSVDPDPFKSTATHGASPNSGGPRPGGRGRIRRNNCRQRELSEISPKSLRFIRFFRGFSQQKTSAEAGRRRWLRFGS
jgi:hypothetical protein